MKRLYYFIILRFNIHVFLKGMTLLTIPFIILCKNTQTLLSKYLFHSLIWPYLVNFKYIYFLFFIVFYIIPVGCFYAAL